MMLACHIYIFEATHICDRIYQNVNFKDVLNHKTIVMESWCVLCDVISKSHHIIHTYAENGDPG